MKFETFNNYWEKSFTPILTYLSKLKHIHFYEDAKTDIFSVYTNFKQKIERFINKEKCKTIDRHKIAALITISILKVKPFTIDFIDNISNTAYYSNEFFSFHCATRIIRAYMVKEADKTNNVKLLDVAMKEIDYPPCRHGSFMSHIQKQLHYIRIQSNFHNSLIFLLAFLYFYIENYHLLFNYIKPGQIK